MSSTVTCLRQARAHSRLTLAMALKPELLAVLWVCPECGARPGRRCVDRRRARRRPHAERVTLGETARCAAADIRELAEAIVEERGREAFSMHSELASLIEPLEIFRRASAAPLAWLKVRADRSKEIAGARKGDEK